MDQLYNDLSKIGLPNEESTSIDTLVEHFEDKLKLCLDKHAPLEQKEYVSRRKFPWYNEEIRTQKVRRRERIWKRYKTLDTLKALKIERNKYKYMLENSKVSVLSKKIDECGRDSKKLYKLITELTGGPKENPFPANIDNEDLANKFADFFLNKIKKIRLDLEGCPKYEPQERECKILDNLAPLSEDEVKSIICDMPTKTCELDVIPTKVFKNVLGAIIKHNKHV